MRIIHRIMMGVADLAVLGLVLFLVTLDATAGFKVLGWGLVSILLVVIVVYLITVIFVNVLMLFMRSAAGWGTVMAKAIISGLLVFFMFPFLLKWGFLLVGSTGVSSMVEGAMLFAFVARAVLSSVLGKRWSVIE